MVVGQPSKLSKARFIPANVGVPQVAYFLQTVTSTFLESSLVLTTALCLWGSVLPNTTISMSVLLKSWIQNLGGGLFEQQDRECRATIHIELITAPLPYFQLVIALIASTQPLGHHHNQGSADYNSRRPQALELWPHTTRQVLYQENTIRSNVVSLQDFLLMFFLLFHIRCPQRNLFVLMK